MAKLREGSGEGESLALDAVKSLHKAILLKPDDIESACNLGKPSMSVTKKLFLGLTYLTQLTYYEFNSSFTLGYLKKAEDCFRGCVRIRIDYLPAIIYMAKCFCLESKLIPLLQAKLKLLEDAQVLIQEIFYR
jgi:hypothetical protein